MTLAPMQSKSKEQRFSDKLYKKTGEYERSSKVYTRSLVSNEVPMKILDVGCGTGLNASFLREMGHEVIGVDLSPVAIAKIKNLGFEGYVCDLQKQTPKASGTFDLIYVSEVIEHVEDTETFLNNLLKSLRPDGQLLLSTPNSSFWPYRVLAMLGHTLSDVQHPGHIRFFSKKSLSQAIESAGFSQLHISARHIYFVLPDGIGKYIPKLLLLLGFKKEFRVKTNTYFWHLGKFRTKANSFWADTLIVQAKAGQLTCKD